MSYRLVSGQRLISLLRALFVFLVVAACQPGGELGSAPVAPQPTVVVGDKSARVSWDSVDGAARYNLYWFAAADASQRALQPSREVSSPLDVANLENGTTYYAALTAVGVGGESSYSNIIAITPQPPPSTPANVETTTAAESVTLHWPAVDGAVSYKVYVVRSGERAAAGVVASPALIAVRETNDTSYVETGLDNGTEYSFVVTALNASGESVSSDLVTATPGPLKALSVGGGHACAVDAMGKLWCWGNNDSGQVGDLSLASTPTPTQTNTLKTWKAVAAGAAHTCANGTDESIVCWGASLPGPVTIAEGAPTAELSLEQRWRSLSAGNEQSCAVRGDGALWCWQITNSNGSAPVLPTRVGFNSDWLDVESGGDFHCARKQDLSLWCWGNNAIGQLGVGDNLPRRAPVPVDSPQRWLKVSAAGRNDSQQFSQRGSGHACAIDSEAKLWCWGNNSRGELGDGSNDTKISPGPISASATWLDVAVGLGHACGVQHDGSLWCWGANDYGQLGDAVRQDQLTPLRVGAENDWRSVVAGDEFTCAVRVDGTIACSGHNELGQLGTGKLAHAAEPVKVMSDVVDVAINGSITCALDSSHRTSCWGLTNIIPSNGSTLPYGAQSYTADFRPRLIDEALLFDVLIVNPQGHFCGLTRGTEFACWGPIADSHFLGQTAIFGTWTRILIGNWSACALDARGLLSCWIPLDSVNFSSDLFAQPPTEIDPGSTWAQAALGGVINCSITTAGELWCWGGWYTGMNTADGRPVGPTPLTRVRVGENQQWRSVAVGGIHACAITTQGTLWCWGTSYQGQLGIGTAGEADYALRQVGAESDWQVVVAAGNRNCALKSNGTSWCWGGGYNSAKQDLNRYGGPADLRPKQIGAGIHWQSITTGDNHSCAIADNNDLYCWGLNDIGQIGDGAAWSTEMRQVQFGTP